MKILCGRRNVLKEIRAKYGLSYRFIFVVQVEDHETPAMYFEPEFIEFVNDKRKDRYRFIYLTDKRLRI